MDAATGELKWQFDPQISKEWDVKSCCGVQNRGVAVWQGHVYVDTIDGRLITLNADTGRWIRKPCDGNGCRSMQFILDQNRLNVAISRAQSLAIVVGDPRLAESPCSSIEDMRRLNLYCWLQSSH